ncbi:MAG: hypothetical protein P4L90_25810 [Rhodopila sp.]|nr:hypothetical protein [Rhodopila sp.]
MSISISMTWNVASNAIEVNTKSTIDSKSTIAYDAVMKKPPDPSPTIRKTMALPASLWDAINEYRHSERIPSEVEAVRRILSEWLAAQPKRTPAKRKAK